MIDLHCHSTFSDGTYTPSQLIQMACQKKMTALALTDHDTIDGIDEFLQAAQATNVCAIPGIEFSTSWYGASLHIVGLFIDHHHPALKAKLTELINSRHHRNLKIIERLQELGCEITFEEVQAETQGKSIGRPHIARVLVRKGYCNSIQETFNKYIGQKQKAYVRRFLPMPSEMIELIHEIGGVAIWAHPLSHGKKSLSRTRSIVSRLQTSHLDGIECFYADYKDLQTQLAKDVANEFGLLYSGGSDFHGENIPDLELGIGYGNLNISDQLLPPIIDKARYYKELL